ncbi:WD40-repeat-containing domain protein [Schizophyllum commune]
MSAAPENTAEYIWQPPQYAFDCAPTLQTTASVTQADAGNSNFARTAKWCPDGSSLLIHCENRTFERLPTPSFSAGPAHADLPCTGTATPALAGPSIVLPQPAPILDFAWYPGATAQSPATHCFVASVRECPVKLLDANSGRLRASYKIVDHRERQIAPHSLAFNLSATRIYCGFEDAIEVFDVMVPGEGTRLLTTPSKKSKDGLKGIISALAFCPSYGSDVFAAGTLSPHEGNIALFRESDGEVPLAFLGGGLRAGVTQLHFNPMQPHLLYAAYRRRPEILSWDLRSGMTAPLATFVDPSAPGPNTLTNQKMRFDIDITGRWLGTGDQAGHLLVYDLAKASGPTEPQHEVETVEVGPTCKVEAHGDAIGSVAFHPLQPIIATASGSRHFDGDEDSSDSDSDSSDEVTDKDEGASSATIRRRIGSGKTVGAGPRTRDASIKFWYAGGSSTQTNADGGER